MSFTRPAQNISSGLESTGLRNPIHNHRTTRPPHYQTCKEFTALPLHMLSLIVPKLKGGVGLRRDNGLAVGSETQTNRENKVRNRQGI